MSLVLPSHTFYPLPLTPHRTHPQPSNRHVPRPTAHLLPPTSHISHLTFHPSIPIAHAPSLSINHHPLSTPFSPNPPAPHIHLPPPPSIPLSTSHSLPPISTSPPSYPSPLLPRSRQDMVDQFVDDIVARHKVSVVRIRDACSRHEAIARAGIAGEHRAIFLTSGHRRLCSPIMAMDPICNQWILVMRIAVILQVAGWGSSGN